MDWTETRRDEDGIILIDSSRNALWVEKDVCKDDGKLYLRLPFEGGDGWCVPVVAINKDQVRALRDHLAVILGGEEET